jgi:hypothetical protein
MTLDCLFLLTIICCPGLLIFLQVGEMRYARTFENQARMNVIKLLNKNIDVPCVSFTEHNFSHATGVIWFFDVSLKYHLCFQEEEVRGPGSWNSRKVIFAFSF